MNGAFPCPGRRVAIVHDWLPVYAGAERVLEQMLHLFPEADLFTLIDAIPKEQRAFLLGKQPRTSFVQRLPRGRTAYRNYFPLMPLAIEQFDLSSYDLILSSSHAFAKGVITGPDQLHVCYCHSPIRYAWDLYPRYLEELGPGKALLARLFLHYIRLWDYRTANGVDAFLANSEFVARRIRKVYGREARVVYPPVAVETFAAQECKEGYYLTAARLVPYKRVDLVVSAFARMPSRRLVVVGDGPELPKLTALATPNISILGYQPKSRLAELMRNARAFVYGAQEDFGIVLVEAQACGTPVIAYGRGGAREIVADGLTGMLFAEQTEEALIHAVEAFERLKFDAAQMRANAERFSTAVFRRAFAEAVETEWTRRAGCR